MGENLFGGRGGGGGGGCSTWRINDQMMACQGLGNFIFPFSQSWRDIHLKTKSWPKLWKYLYLMLINKKFERFCHQPDLDIYVKLTVQIRDCIRKTPSAHYASGVGDFMQSLPSYEWWPVLWCLDYRALSDLPSCKSDSWKSCTLKCLC